MKTLIKIILLIGILAASIFTYVHLQTRPLVRLSEQFLQNLQNNHTDEAFKLGSIRFQEAMTSDQLAVFAKRSGIFDFSTVNWWSRSIGGDTGTLSGTLDLRSGEVVPLTFSLVYEAGTWKIITVETKVPGALINAMRVPPSDDIVVGILHETIGYVVKGLNTGDYGEFHGSLYSLWRTNVTIEEVSKDVSSFKQILPILEAATRVEPVFTEVPKFDEKGLLIVAGYFPSTQLNLYFRLKYIQEDKEWRLGGYSFDTKSSVAPLPGDNQSRDSDAKK